MKRDFQDNVFVYISFCGVTPCSRFRCAEANNTTPGVNEETRSSVTAMPLQNRVDGVYVHRKRLQRVKIKDNIRYLAEYSTHSLSRDGNMLSYSLEGAVANTEVFPPVSTPACNAAGKSVILD